MTRSPIVAVIIGVIPLVQFYLIYKWVQEFKAAAKLDYNEMLQFLFMLIPIVNIYFWWKFYNDVEAAAKKKGIAGYPLGATLLFVISIFTILPIFYMLYRTQEILNEL